MTNENNKNQNNTFNENEFLMANIEVSLPKLKDDTEALCHIRSYIMTRLLTASRE